MFLNELSRDCTLHNRRIKELMKAFVSLFLYVLSSSLSISNCWDGSDFWDNRCAFRYRHRYVGLETVSLFFPFLPFSIFLLPHLSIRSFSCLVLLFFSLLIFDVFLSSSRSDPLSFYYLSYQNNISSSFPSRLDSISNWSLFPSLSSAGPVRTRIFIRCQALDRKIIFCVSVVCSPGRVEKKVQSQTKVLHRAVDNDLVYYVMVYSLCIDCRITWLV